MASCVTYSDIVIHIVYQAFTQQMIVIRTASWPHIIHLRVNTNAILQHAYMQEEFSGVKVSHWFNRWLH